MIPVVAPPLDEAPRGLRRFRTAQVAQADAPTRDKLERLTVETDGDGQATFRLLSPIRLAHRWSVRGAARIIVISVGASTALAAAIIGRKHAHATK
jgi:hypothetical protein